LRTKDKIVILFAVLTFISLLLFFADAPVGAPASQNVQVSSSQNGVFQTSVLSSGSPLVGNVTLDSIPPSAQSSNFQLYLLNDAQYTAWITSQPHQSYPQVYYYNSGQNVNSFGKAAQIEFPLHLSINSTGNYYIAIFSLPSQYEQYSIITTPKFFLTQSFAPQNQQYSFGTPGTTFAFLAGVLSLALTSFEIYVSRKESRNRAFQ